MWERVAPEGNIIVSDNSTPKVPAFFESLGVSEPKQHAPPV
jgi:hypothetical protein